MSIPKKVRDTLRHRAGGCCEICGVPANNAHHRRNRSQGGRDVLSNLMLLCGSGVTGCHGTVTDNPNWSEARGYTIKGTEAVPSEVAVCMWWGAKGRQPLWVLLDDLGGATEVDGAEPVYTRCEDAPCCGCCEGGLM